MREGKKPALFPVRYCLFVAMRITSCAPVFSSFSFQLFQIFFQNASICDFINEQAYYNHVQHYSIYKALFKTLI
jgi:hypothetical protein